MQQSRAGCKQILCQAETSRSTLRRQNGNAQVRRISTCCNIATNAGRLLLPTSPRPLSFKRKESKRKKLFGNEAKMRFVQSTSECLVCRYGSIPFSCTASGVLIINNLYTFVAKSTQVPGFGARRSSSQTLRAVVLKSSWGQSV